MIELNPQSVDLAMQPQTLTDGAMPPRLHTSEITELQNQMNAGLVDSSMSNEEFAEFQAEESEFFDLIEVDAEEFFDRFCS